MPPSRHRAAHDRTARTVCSGTLRAALAIAAVTGAVGLGCTAGSAAAGPAGSSSARPRSGALSTTEGAGRVRTASPGANLRRILQSLRPGDVLRLEPGTYILGGRRSAPALLRPHLVPGTADHRIRVTAADRAHPPVLVGAVQFDGADYWTVSHLRVRGAVPRTPGVVFDGGTGWMFVDSEVSGAADTGALANVAVQGSTARGRMPTDWSLARNCVHGGGDDPVGHPGMMHEVYVTAQGEAYGRITHNVLYDTPDGAAVKVGFGGEIGALGASDVLIADNTMVDNGRQVLVFGRVDRVVITDNAMASTTDHLSDGRTRPAIYLNRLVGVGSVVSRNDVWDATRGIFDLGSAPGSWQDGGGNAVRPQSPEIGGSGCGLHRTGPAATAP